MHVLHECTRFQIYRMPCPEGHPLEGDVDKKDEAKDLRKQMQDALEDFDRIFFYLHRQKEVRERFRQLEGQEIWEPFSQPFPEEITVADPIPFPQRREIERPAAQSVSDLTAQQQGGFQGLNRLYSLRGMELLRQNQQSLRPSQVRTIETQSARALNNLRQIGGGRTTTAASGRGSGRGFIQNAAAQLKRDIGIAASFRREQPRKKKKELITPGGEWTSTFPPGYFG